MATAEQAPISIQGYAQEVFKSDPKAALDLVIAHTEKMRHELAILQLEAKQDTECEMGPNGLTPKNMGGLWRLAGIYADSDMVPKQFQGKRANTFIGLQMAIRCGVDLMAFLQKCYIVHGRPAIESTLAIAMANRSGILSGRIGYTMAGEGDSRSCVAHAVIKETGEVIEETVSIRTAKDMGWFSKDGSLWPKMPDLMLKYRSAMWLIRTNLPEVLFGMTTKEEADDVGSFDDLPLPTRAAKPLTTEDIILAAGAPETNIEVQPVKQPEKVEAIPAKEPTKPVDSTSAEKPTSPPAKPEAAPAAGWQSESIDLFKSDLGLPAVGKLKRAKILTKGDAYAKVMAGEQMGLEPEVFTKLSELLNDEVTNEEAAKAGH